MLNALSGKHKLLIPGVGQTGKYGGDLLQHQPQSEFLGLHVQITGPDPAHIKDLIHSPHNLLTGDPDPVCIFPDLGGILRVFHQQHDKTRDGTYRNPEIMRHTGQEIAGGTVDILCLLEHHFLQITLCRIRCAQKNDRDPVGPAIGKMDHIDQILTARPVCPVDKGLFPPVIFLNVFKSGTDPSDILQGFPGLNPQGIFQV